MVGGGHNGLVAAGYLARAGRRVTVLERLDHVGGAAVSAHAFDGVDARLSRYSYLVSLLPRRIVDDLGAQVRLARRRYSSYTPDPGDRRQDRPAGRARRRLRRRRRRTTTAGFDEFYRRCRTVTQRLWPTMTGTAAHRTTHGDTSSPAVTPTRAAWEAMIDQPIGTAITDAVATIWCAA